MSDKLFLLCASLTKSGPGQVITSVMQGYRVTDDEEKAKGGFVTSVMKEKPDFSISQILCMAVPEDVIAMVSAPGDKP